MIQDEDMIIDPDMIDLNLLDGKKSHTILLDALDASVRVVSRIQKNFE